MIKILAHQGTLAPVIVCDNCNQRIEEAGMGVAITATIGVTLNDGDLSEVAYAHRGACHDALEAKFSTSMGSPGWDELRTHLVYLLENIKFPPAAAQAHLDKLSGSI